MVSSVSLNSKSALRLLSHDGVPTRCAQMLAWAVRQGPHFALPHPSLTDSSSRYSQLTVLETSVLLQTASLTVVVPVVLITGTPYVNVGFSA